MNLYQKRGNKKKTIKLYFEFMILFKSYCISQNINFIEFFQKIYETASPLMGYYTRKIGGKKSKIPIIITYEDSKRMLAKWIIESLKGRSEQDFKVKLLNELVDIYNDNSIVLRRRKAYHLELFENQSYIRFLKKRKRRW